MHERDISTVPSVFLVVVEEMGAEERVRKKRERIKFHSRASIPN